MILDRFDPRVTVSASLFDCVPLYECIAIHGEMIWDTVRVNAFREALRQAAAGKTVLDIGTGMGILSMLAVQAGAKHVYAVEGSRIADTAEELIAENGLSGQITLLRGYSHAITLPQRCDLLVSEMVGHYGIEEDICEIFADARERLLTPCARIIPQTLDLFLAPVQVPEFQEACDRYTALDAQVGVPFFQRTRIPALIRSSYIGDFASYTRRIVAQPRCIASIDITSASTSDLSVGIHYHIKKSGIIDGCIGWFACDLGYGIRIQTSPWDEKTHWQQCFFPHDPVEVRLGDNVLVKFSYKKPDDERLPRFSLNIEKI